MRFRRVSTSFIIGLFLLITIALMIILLRVFHIVYFLNMSILLVLIILYIFYESTVYLTIFKGYLLFDNKGVYWLKKKQVKDFIKWNNISRIGVVRKKRIKLSLPFKTMYFIKKDLDYDVTEDYSILKNIPGYITMHYTKRALKEVEKYWDKPIEGIGVRNNCKKSI